MALLRYLAVATLALSGIGYGQSTLKTSAAAVRPTASETKYLITLYVVMLIPAYSGDSYTQTGFQISGTKPSTANPIGNPAFPGSTTAGTTNWIGYLVDKFNTSTTLAYNFAYGGATVDASIIPPWSTTSGIQSVVDQVRTFSGSLANRPSYATWTAGNTLVGCFIGINDIGGSYSKSGEDALLSKDLDRLFTQMQTVYDAGARNFFFMTVPPIDKTPQERVKAASLLTLERAAIASWNKQLASKLAVWTAKNSESWTQIVDTAPAFDAALASPSTYGAPNDSCTNTNGVSCLWWNAYHPGTQIHKMFAQAVVAAYKGTFF